MSGEGNDAQQELLDIIYKHLGKKRCSIAFLGKGESNENYLAIHENQKYVLRRKRSDREIFESLLYKESINYRFLESQKVDFIPRSIFYDKDQNIHLVTFIPGKDVLLHELNLDQTDSFIDKTLALYEVGFSDYKVFCRDNCYPMQTEIEGVTDWVEIYGQKVFELILPFLKDINLINWIESHIAENRRWAESLKQSKHSIFTWGDSGKNIRIDNNTNLRLIDGEHSRFIKPFIGFGYLFIHGGPLEKEQYQRFVDRYSEYFNVSKEQVETVTKFDARMLLLHEFIWALRRYFEFERRGYKDANYYKTLAEKRKRGLEEFDKVIKSNNREDLLNFYATYISK